MTTSDDQLRRELIESGAIVRELEQTVAQGGDTWTTIEMQAEFEVVGFAAPLVVVRRKSDNQLGTLEFTGSPRVYFGWAEHQE